MIALIMAGGSGTRFWPASRAANPKQFLRVTETRSMLQLTYDRLKPLIQPDRVYVVTAASQARLVRENLPEIPHENVIIEPFGMNTAPCIALALAQLRMQHPDTESMVVLPADHVIKNVDVFLASLARAEEVAQSGALVTFGIIPQYPATGYGYIEGGKELEPGVLEVQRFKEKPNVETATEFLRQGNFYWNSGMFCWTLDALHKAFEDHLPQALQIAEDVAELRLTGAPEEDIATAYAMMPKTSVDIGIMERASRRAVIPVDYGWSDVGSWKAMADISSADGHGNSFRRRGVAVDAFDNYIYSDKFVALIGVENLCVVETEDSILITAKDRSEEVKKVVEHLQQEKMDDLL